MPDFQFSKQSFDCDADLRDLKTKPSSYFEKMGQKNVVKLFHYAVLSVTSYKIFLKQQKVDPRKVKTITDFKQLPTISKQTYLRAFPYQDLFPNRDLSRVTTISATSGSTGEPFYFPRGEEQDAQYEYIAELFLKNQFEIDKKSTLGIIGFGLGIWIGGIFTYKVLNKISAKGFRLSLLPVGPNKELFLKSLKKFGPMYDQVLIMGYPPFIKDIIDEAGDYGINWKDHQTKILTATESFSEEFRAYLAKHACVRNPLTDIINIYGTVEFGTMAHETALTNLIRIRASKDPSLAKQLFGTAEHLPTLAQYHPNITYFEEVNGEVIGSGFGSSFPLIRYSFPDRGGVIPFDRMMEKLKEIGINITKEVKSSGIAQTVLRLPFVYVYERADATITVRGANIYAEHIRHALMHRAVRQKVTGKLTMIKKEDEKMNEYFEVNIELKKQKKSSDELTKKVQEIIVETLRRFNSEYDDQYRSVPKIMTPPVILWSYGHELHFKPGAKQKWAKR